MIERKGRRERKEGRGKKGGYGSLTSSNGGISSTSPPALNKYQIIILRINNVDNKGRQWKKKLKMKEGLKRTKRNEYEGLADGAGFWAAAFGASGTLAPSDFK
jgi:hypothetical protein